MPDEAYKLIAASEALQAAKGSRKSPAQMMLETLPPGHKSYKQMAERYGVHQETMRRLCKAVNRDGTPKVNAPTSAMQQGDMIMYVFTPEDVEELDAYFEKRGKIVPQ